MPVRIDSFGEIARFVSTLSHQFEDASRELGVGESSCPFALALGSMAVDVVDRDEAFVVTVDLPGFDREAVDVDVTERAVRIEADREPEVDGAEMDGRYVQHERRYATTSRTVRLPGAVDTENVEARMKNGVLRITLPKLAPERGRDVEIEVEG